jgi:hypothetical protein
MNGLDEVFIEMLNHIDNHEEGYKGWSNEDIVKTWIVAQDHKIKNLFISNVSKSSEKIEKLEGEIERLNILVNCYSKTIEKAAKFIGEDFFNKTF